MTHSIYPEVMKKNYIVCHYLNGKLIGRWDFKQNIAWAVDHCEFLKESVYQRGQHFISAYEEYTQKAELAYRFSIK